MGETPVCRDLHEPTWHEQVSIGLTQSLLGKGSRSLPDIRCCQYKKPTAHDGRKHCVCEFQFVGSNVLDVSPAAQTT